MSKIDKLSILGVRSFDNQRHEVIQFYTPLTLIVGHNGSGKTTIIECLKYATTGELPPNSKGGAFIHDPKLCGEKEVLAQTKLSFFATTQARMVATRNLQLTVKKTTRSQKTLEGNLVIVNHGERQSLSTRVAELDRMLPEYLGVSKAILDSVIFCHQDESLWPMSEPSALKKRFDEIFEALKYTKAIDNIKALRKSQNEKLGKFKISMEHAKEDSNKAKKVAERINELSVGIEALRAEHLECKAKAQEADQKAREAWNHVARYTEVVESLKAARKNKAYYEKDVADLLQDLKQLPDTDEQLQSQIEQYQERLDLHTKRQEDQTKRYKQIEGDIRETRTKQSDKRTEVGKLEERKVTHEQKIKDREAAIKNSAREHNIRGYDTELDDMQISEFLERITKLRNDQNHRVDKVRRDTSAEVQKAQEVLDKLRERRSVLQESKRSAKEQISQNDRKIVSSQSELDNVTIDEAGKSSLEANIEDLEGRLEKSKQQMSNANSASKIKEINDHLQKLEDEGDSLKSELLQSTKQAGELARLDHMKKEVQNRQRSLDTMKGAHSARLQDLLDHEWNPTSLEVDFQNVLEAKKRKVEEAERQRDGVSRELEQVEFKLKSARDSQKRKEQTIGECIDMIREKADCDPDEYSSILAEIQSDRDTRRSDVEGFMNMRKYFSDCIATAQSHEPACRLCARPFNDDKSVQQFIKKLEKSISKGALDTVQKELAELETDLAKAKEASSSYDTWMRLSETELPELKENISKAEKQRDELLRRIDEHDTTVGVLEESKRDVNALTKLVSTIAQHVADLQNLNDQIKNLATSQQSQGSWRTLDEIQERIEVSGAESKEQRKVLNKLQAESERSKDLISSLSLELGNAQNKLSAAHHELEKKATISSQITELKESSKQQRDHLQNFDVQLQELGPKFSEEEAKLNDTRERGNEKERQYQLQVNDLTDTIRRLQRTDEDVKAYIEQGGPAKLEKCQRDVEAFDQELATLDSELRQVTVEISKIQKEVANQGEHKRVINDNIKFRQRKRELEETNVEIQKLADQNAEADQHRYHRDAERLQAQHQTANMEAASKAATMKVKDDQLKQLIDDWDTEYHDAKKNFRKARIDVETTKAAVEDLGKYGGALDKAIMKYHGIKMEEINHIIDELWRSTYQGTDVDTILIRSDNETAKENRSYNYRVCMIKQDAEMDMRGRCSAGQKVLASIIIRLALAECFGVNCGLIALDEPTTNLDRENIRSLAESLHQIIQHRQRQRNFQLIVITHDEEFLRYMKCADFCDHYWRVSRNEKQKSTIERQSIAEVM